jgi:hypothetical protein
VGAAEGQGDNNTGVNPVLEELREQLAGLQEQLQALDARLQLPAATSVPALALARLAVALDGMGDKLAKQDEALARALNGRKAEE